MFNDFFPKIVPVAR